ncbi:MAG TPA: tRNA uridine(34) 5-carboxymethylaminomethyl modification radical SAM/GNAT enzyme Elp3 [Patescibacteria group bacterium]|nr:tRNA uridine(34) 5-carboxymethylaminomethyl modification radical SAM/GNAT enzyme Elp3 [Patescibacteria group bacterium]
MQSINNAKQELIIRACERGITKLRDFMILKNEISTQFKIDSLPNYGLTQVYEELLKKKKVKKNSDIERLLRKAKMRTLSGVAVVSVLTKEYGCPGNCLYCPTEKNMPKSYLSNEPAVMRAILADFDPYRQIEIRLTALEKSGHSTDKIELIIMGGSFNALPTKYQYWFVKECYRACNNFQFSIFNQFPMINYQKKKKNKITRYQDSKLNLVELKRQLQIEQSKNESTKSRVIGLTLETRPDLITEKELVKFRDMGATRIEIGVQSIYNEVLKKNRRGHDVSETIRATKLMKDFGFKVSYHMMPGLYGSNLKKDLQMFKDLFSSQDFQPDQLKIYPCVVVKDSDLYKLWKEKKYKAYTDKQLLKLICDIKKIIPPYVRISRLIRDIPEESIIAGNKTTNLRQLIDNHSQKEGWQCQCIRCREIKDKETNEQEINKTKISRRGVLYTPKLNKIEYNASGGEEVFLELIDNHSHLYALLRLRLPVGAGFKPAPTETAIIREVHTYGQALDVGQIGEDAKQHKGLGKNLIVQAEQIARKAGYKKIAVISGVGAREYYKKIGYKLEDTYMVKTIN